MEPIKSSATHGELIEDRIRQIVREEIAAHEERQSRFITDRGIYTGTINCSPG